MTSGYGLCCDALQRGLYACANENIMAQACYVSAHMPCCAGDHLVPSLCAEQHD